MGKNKSYSKDEIQALALIFRDLNIPLPPYTQGGGKWGKKFWEGLRDEGRLPQCLVDRLASGGDLTKWATKNREKLRRAIEKLSRAMFGEEEEEKESDEIETEDDEEDEDLTPPPPLLPRGGQALLFSLR